MDSEVYSFVLKNTLDEMQKICPEVKSAFALTKDWELLAKDEKTPEDTVTRAVSAFEEVLEKARAIGGVEEVTIEGINGWLNVSRLDEIYLIAVASKKADLSQVNMVTHVLVPTVLKLVEKLGPAPLNKDPSTSALEPEEPAIESTEEPMIERVEEPEPGKHEEESEPRESPESILPEAPVNQFIVEDMKGLLAPTDTVRIDSSVMEQWKELYEGRVIEEADVETFGGKAIRAKVKPIKDPKLDGQGKIQIPNKIQLALEVRKGELVKVKPGVD
jgi:predicted regulator of Ras-like GTPase activity (Roadblock/LC7/MglB family)